MKATKSLSKGTIALIAVVCTLILSSTIILTYYLRSRRRRLHLHPPNQTRSHNSTFRPAFWPTKPSPSRTNSGSSSLEHVPDLDTRKQTHADRKVFSWFEKVDPDADERGIFRMSVPDRRSVWKLSEEEMRDLSAELERLRGRESIMTCADGRGSLAWGRTSAVT